MLPNGKVLKLVGVQLYPDDAPLIRDDDDISCHVIGEWDIREAGAVIYNGTEDRGI
jgi:hypothetical protein